MASSENTIYGRRILLSVTMAFLFGAGWVISKHALNEFPPILLAAFRFGLAAAILVGFTKAPVGQLRETALISTLVVAVPFSMAYTSLKSLDVSTTVVLLQLDAPVVIILSVIFLGERPSYRKVGGTILALSGAFVISGGPDLSNNYLELFLVVCSVLVWGIGQIMVRKMHDIGGFTRIIWVSVFATPQLLLMSLIFEQDQLQYILDANWITWISIVYLGLVMTPVGIGLWYGLVRRHSFSSVAPFLLLAPVVSVLGGITVLGEELTVRFVVGAAIVLLGIASILIEPQTREKTRHGEATIG